MVKCQYEDCGKRASFGFPNTKIAITCAEHKEIDFVNVVSKKCLYENCLTIPVYGIKGTKLALYCSEHKEETHVNIKDKTCLNPNCLKRPIYGVKESKIALYCKEHKEENHINIKSKNCQYNGCTTRPVYGVLNTKIALYCKEHKEENHVDLISKKCHYPNCLIKPSYGDPNTKIPLYCLQHKEESHTDIKNKTCLNLECKTQPRYGIPGYSPEYCTKHKLPNMIVYPLKVKNEDYKQCEYCNLKIHYKQQFCTGCKSYIDLGITVKSHHKELAIKALLEDNNIEFRHDSIVNEGCSKRRPDFVINKLNGDFVILEVDEFQHKRKTYTCECEITRMKQIFFDIGVSNVTFIRYNPDSYKSNKQETNTQREDFLIRLIKKEIKKDSEYPLSVVYLYYDHFDRHNYEFENIDPYI